MIDERRFEQIEGLILIIAKQADLIEKQTEKLTEIVLIDRRRIMWLEDRDLRPWWKKVLGL